MLCWQRGIGAREIIGWQRGIGAREIMRMLCWQRGAGAREIRGIGAREIVGARVRVRVRVWVGSCIRPLVDVLEPGGYGGGGVSGMHPTSRGCT